MGAGRPAKRRRVTPPIDDDKVSETIKASDLFGRAAEWDLEQDYEQRSRKKKSKESTRLPIKDAEGALQRFEATVESSDESDSMLGTDSDAEAENNETPPTDDTDAKPNIPLSQQIFEAKEEIARLAALLNEDPEEHAGSFKKLANVGGADAPVTIKKLVLAAQAAVYKDVIPGYRIRAYKEDDLSTKVSKDVRQTRQYEQALVSGYQVYVKTLTTLTKVRGKSGDAAALKTVALSCACTLLLSVPHFNLRTELLSILVRELSGREPTPDFIKAVETLERFFQEDEDGAPSLEAVNLVSKMMKASDYTVREEVLNTFLCLRLLTELSKKSSTTQTDKDAPSQKIHGRKIKKEKWEHRSKKERKVARERKAVEKDMREASAAVDYEAREKMQSETLKAVFVIYFRILKARSPSLMGAVLEGLAKYAHLINQDFFGDILEALKDIVGQAESVLSEGGSGDDEDDDRDDTDMVTIRNRSREALLSTQTAFTLLSQQEVSKSASALHLDLSFFTSHIYRSLYPLTLDADIELGPKSIHLADPHQASGATDKESAAVKSRVNISTPVLLLTRVLTSILLTPSQAQSTSPQTIATFAKRIITCAINLPEKSGTAMLSILSKIADKHGKKLEPLWYSDERKGDGVYNGAADSIPSTNVFSMGSGVWEGELLRKHWSPGVREQWKMTEDLIQQLGR